MYREQISLFFAADADAHSHIPNGRYHVFLWHLFRIMELSGILTRHETDPRVLTLRKSIGRLGAFARPPADCRSDQDFLWSRVTKETRRACSQAIGAGLQNHDQVFRLGRSDFDPLAEKV